jgi:hypothetical protein
MPTKDEMFKFQQEIETLVAGTDYNYMEAIVEYCNLTGMEIELASTLVNKDLKAKIAIDAENLNMLPKASRLPI